MRMLKYLYLFLLAIALTFGAQSCKTSEKPATQVEEKVSLVPTEKALLWKIERDDIEEPSYLYGTIHIIEEEKFFLPPGTEESIEDVSSMVFEIDMAEMSDLGAQMGLLTKAFMNGGTTLSDLLSAEDYQTVKDYFAEMGLPLFMLERIKPLFLSALVGTDMEAFSGFGENGMASYEFYFYEEAKHRQLATKGLETMEYQMSIFDSIPYEAQAEMLVESIEMAEEGNEMYDMTIELYQNQDIQAMVEMMSEEGGIEGYESILLTNRNRDWIPKMEVIMEEGPAFFAVGAGHLGGETGVIALLREQGYTLTPLSEQDAPNN